MGGSLRWSVAGFVCVLVVMVGGCRQVEPTDPARSAVVLDEQAMAGVDEAIASAIEAGDIPGAVLLVGVGGERVHHAAYGDRAVEPQREPMTRETIFDLASLTKVICATAVMMLADRGELDVHEPVASYLPAFGSGGKEEVTVEQLLLHRGGLAPANPMSDYADGPAAGKAAILSGPPRWEPGERFAYSDLGHIVLAEVVEAVDGRPLDRFAREEIFEPLGMDATGYNPPAAWRDRIAPTEKRDGAWRRGAVHDPRAYALGGVAGHAGLFSTAEDLGRFCEMILAGGRYGDVRILSERAVRAMTRPHYLDDGSDGRAYAFDVDTAYASAPRGEGFAVGSTFGHTGFTGTSMWLAPEHEAYVILLTNRVHPDGSGRVTDLRRQVATAVAAAIPGTAGDGEGGDY